MKKILFPTDFSNASEKAFDFAVSLAHEMDATIDIVNIYHLPFVDATNVPPEYIEEILEEKRKVVKNHLEEFVKNRPGKLIGELLTVYGVFVPQEIKDLVRERGYDLVIMGTRGEHHSKVEKILGSVTTHTMMQVECPVLAVPEEATWKEVKRIAFATDFELKDHSAVNQLMDFAALLAAEVHFVHVETEPKIGEMQDSISLPNYPFKFTDFAVVNSPTVIEGIDKYIREKQVDLLALFIPKRRLWERLFHSSFTKKMTFHSRTPLLVFQG
jgi:nucleotide-binding universal stress UspA family protein